jgi:hypothetical protein
VGGVGAPRSQPGRGRQETAYSRPDVDPAGNRHILLNLHSECFKIRKSTVKTGIFWLLLTKEDLAITDLHAPDQLNLVILTIARCGFSRTVLCYII